MSDEQPHTVICRYRVKEGQEDAMVALLKKHWPALHAEGLVTDEPPVIYRGLASQKPGGEHGAARTFVEIFSWKNADAPRVAHDTPAVLKVWEPMGAICESLDFPHFERLELELVRG